MISIKNLSKTYTSVKGVSSIALNDITLDFPSTGMIFIVGKSGCGKSTFLNLLGGMDKCERGEIIVNGLKINELSALELDNYRNYNVGFVFQEYRLIEELTAKENIDLSLKFQNKGLDVDLLFRDFEIEGQENKYIDEMSGGQKQRVAIIRALAKKPQIILCDEPTGALDPENSNAIFKILKAISKDTLVIIVSHELEFAQKYGDQIIKLKDGKTEGHYEKIKEDIDIKPKILKCHLPFLLALKLSFIGIFKRKMKLIISLIISIICLSGLGVCTSYLKYQEAKIFVNSMYEDNNYYVPLKMNANLDTEIAREDLTKMQNKFGANKFYPIYQYDEEYDDRLDFSLLFEGNTNYYFYNFSTLIGVMEMNKDIAKDYNFKLLAGKYPTNDNEIMISDFIYTYFMDLGYKDYFTNETCEINNYDELIGKKFGSNEMFDDQQGLIISGIIDTNFDYKKFGELKKFDIAKDSSENDIELRFYDRLLCGAERIGFVSNVNSKTIIQIGAALSGDKENDIEFTKYFAKTIDDNCYYIINDTINQIKKSKEFLMPLATVCIVLSTIMLIFSFIFLFNYFSSSIIDERKYIGKLRMLGVSKKQIIKIYYLRTILLSLLIFIFSLAFANIIIESINIYLANAFYIYFTILSFDIMSLLVMGAFSITVSSLSALIPLFMNSSDYPMEYFI